MFISFVTPFPLTPLTDKQTESIKETSPRLVAVAAYPNPITVYSQIEPKKVVKKVYVKRIAYNCVATLKASGDLPNIPVTSDGYARTIPIKPLEIQEGETAVVVTKEGWTGHVLKVRMKEGKLVSVVEGGYKNGVGRVVDPKVIKGEANVVQLVDGNIPPT